MTLDREALDRAAIEADVWGPILSCDPGGAHSGLALRVGRDVLEAVTVEFPPTCGLHTDPITYARHVVEVAESLITRRTDEIAAAAAQRGVPVPEVRHAVETLVGPTAVPTKGRRAAVAPSVLASLPGAATVLGVVVGTWPDTILVAPHGGGQGWESLPREIYPPNLIDRSPVGWLRDGRERKHQRSAWAIAGVAHELSRSTHSDSSPGGSTHAQSDRAAAEAVVSLAVQARPDPADAAEILAAIEQAVTVVPGGQRVAGRLVDLVKVTASLLGASPEHAERMKSEAWSLMLRRGAA